MKDIVSEVYALISFKKYCPENGCALTIEQVGSCDRCMASMIDILYQVHYAQEIERVKQESYRQGVLFRDRMDGDPWIWIGDGQDHIESLACPVLIDADQLRHEISKGRQQEVSLEEIRGILRWRTFGLDESGWFVDEKDLDGELSNYDGKAVVVRIGVDSESQRR